MSLKSPVVGSGYFGSITGSGGSTRARFYPSSSAERQFCRSYAPKYASYFGDGLGRDSYIILNNGGLTSKAKPFMMSRPFRRTIPGTMNSQSKDAAAVRYMPDGTGRDSYVIQNSGGLVSDYLNSQKNEKVFQSTLRINEAPVVPTRSLSRSDITNFRNWPSMQARRKSKVNARLVTALTRRLNPERTPGSFTIPLTATTTTLQRYRPEPLLEQITTRSGPSNMDVS